MVSAWRFRSRAQVPAQVSNCCGSLFVISSADIRNSSDPQNGVSFVFDAAKPFRTGKLSCFLNPDTKELVLNRYKPEGFIYSGGLIAAVQHNGR